MDRLLRLIAPLRRAVLDAAAAWDRFWFTPTDALTLGLIRILSGCMLIYTHAVWGLEFDPFFDALGWQDRELVQTFLGGSAAYSFWWFVPDDWRFTVHCLSLAVLACYTLGLFLRGTSVLAFAIVVSYAHRVPQATFGLDQINTLTTAYLMAAYVLLPARDAVGSLDRVLSRLRTADDGAPRPQAAVCVALRLIQLHLCIIYFFSGLCKLKGDTWWDGTAIWLAVTNLEYQSGDLTWLAWAPALVDLATIGTVAFEMFFPIFIWNRSCRPVLIAAGLLLHFSIGKFLGMWTFGMAMQICYLAFIPPETLRSLFSVRTQDLPPPSAQPDIESPAAKPQTTIEILGH